jgi:hypothetical protein
MQQSFGAIDRLAACSNMAGCGWTAENLPANFMSKNKHLVQNIKKKTRAILLDADEANINWTPLL